MNGLEALKKIEDSYREQKGKLLNDPFIHLHERMWFLAVEKELTLFRTMLKVALSEDSDKKFIEEATEEDIREAYRNDELPKKEELSADDWVKLFGIAKEAIGDNQKKETKK